MYTVYFISFDYSKHFDTLEEAIKHGKDSGFECSIINPQGEVI